MLQVDRPEKKPMVGQDPELLTKNQLTSVTLPQNKEDLNEKIMKWREIAKTVC